MSQFSIVRQSTHYVKTGVAAMRLPEYRYAFIIRWPTTDIYDIKLLRMRPQ